MDSKRNIQLIDDDSKNDHKYQVSLLINGHIPALVNSLRRTMISEIPNVGFDTKTQEDISLNKIRIIENTSALHNEFISHRIGLVPICVYNSGRLNINTVFNKKTCQREYHFQWRGEVPKFVLNVVNDETTRESYKVNRPADLEKDDNILIVTTNDFKIKSTIEKPDPDEVSSFITPDIITLNSEKPSQRVKNLYKSFIILNKLKVGASGKGESLKIECVPNIGTGLKHAIYSPVGTVSYKFLEASQDEQDLVFRYYLNNLSTERKNKGLPDFDDEEKAEIRKTYDHLDAKRVYQRDEKGRANSIHMKVESNGGMVPVKIVEYSIDVLSWRLRDIITCCIAARTKEGINYQLLNKVEITETPTKMDAYDIKLDGEGHTVGNLITNYLQELYLGNILEFVSYIKPHPLEDNVIVRIKLSPKLDTVKLLTWLKDNKELTNPTLANKLATLEVSNLTDCQENKKSIALFVFLQGLNACLHSLGSLNRDWKGQIQTIVQTFKNNNFLNYSPDNENDEWYPNVDVVGKLSSDLAGNTMFQLLNEHSSEFI